MDTGLPAPFDQVKDGSVKEAIRKIVAALAAGYHVQHNTDDTHSTITASGTISERGRTTPMGEWTNIQFSAANFTGSASMTWTVTAAGAVTLAFMRIGKSVCVVFRITSTTVGGTPDTTLKITVPGLPPAALNSITNQYSYSDNGTLGTGQAAIVASSSATALVIQLFIASAGNWAGSAANTTVNGQIWYATP